MTLQERAVSLQQERAVSLQQVSLPQGPEPAIRLFGVYAKGKYLAGAADKLGISGSGHSDHAPGPADHDRGPAAAERDDLAGVVETVFAGFQRRGGRYLINAVADPLVVDVHELLRTRTGLAAHPQVEEAKLEIAFRPVSR